MRARRAFTLPELLLGFGVLLVFMGAVVGLFTRGYQSFHFLQSRQSVQGQVLRLKGVLEADFRRTHYRSVGVEKHQVLVDGQSQSRDQICCLGLDNWSEPGNFKASTGIPIWNRYIVYQTSTEPEGRLERLVVEPGGPLRVRPLDNLSAPPGVVGRQLLSSNLLGFACQVDAYEQDVQVTFELRETGGARGVDQNRINETFKAVFRWVPNNTVPKF
jgi:hypothetical protein